MDAAGEFGDGGGWLLFQPLHQDPLKRSPSRPIRHGSQLFPLIGSGGPADVGAAAGGSDDSRSSLSHRGTVPQYQQLSHTQPAEAEAHELTTNNTRLGDSQRLTLSALFTSASLHPE